MGKNIINIALFGLGRIGQMHAINLIDHKDFNLKYIFDKNQKLVNQKYSLTYYLSVGDQNCSEPGHFQLYSPSEEIIVTEGMVVIFPASRNHYAVYNGRKDRIMVGINFSSLL